MNNREWSSQALEVLGPLRYWMSELLDAIDTHNRFAKKLNQFTIPEHRVLPAKAASQTAEEFFTSGGRLSLAELSFRFPILAVLNKPEGRGSGRHWKGFLFDTGVQSEVEQFMLAIHHPDYFFVNPDDLEKNDVGNYVLEDLWVSATRVQVKTTKTRTNYSLSI